VGCQVTGFSVLLQVVWGGVGGGVAAEVGDAAVSGNWISQRVWGVSVGKSVMGSLKRQMRWKPINYIG
jgi:hypothetical protein